MTAKRNDEDLVLVLQRDERDESACEGEEVVDLVELLLDAHAEREAREEAAALVCEPARIDGVVIGRVVAVRGGGPIVSYGQCPSPAGLAARSAAVVSEADVGRRAALLFEGGDASRPILMGLIHGEEEAAESPPGFTVRETDERIEVVCKKAISLACGDASVTITPSGKIILRGKYLLSRAAGVNRIRGGSVQIN